MTRPTAWGVLLVAILSVSFVQELQGAPSEQSLGVFPRLRRLDDGHGHEDEHSDEPTTCAVTEHILADGFNKLSEQLSLTGPGGVVCMVEEEHAHEEGEEEHTGPLNLTCESTFEFIEMLLLRLNLTDDCCLENGTACEEEPPAAIARPSSAEAYGYGFLMIILVSLFSLMGITCVPFLQNKKFVQFYKYFYTLMIALGASALFCDAVLHLIPEAFGLHGHGVEEHAHEEEGEEEDQSFIWKGVVVIVGTYIFFLFETILHTWNPHPHSHGLEPAASKEGSPDGSPGHSATNGLTHNESETNVLVKNEAKVPAGTVEGVCLEPTMPHGACKDTDAGNGGGILHPMELSSEQNNKKVEVVKSSNICWRFYYYLKSIKPLAWLIIFGDAIHNFADGLALGAAISQSLSLGVSTMIALLFHEIPHELGDFVILISTGMQWYIALLFNFFSALTAIIGFFVGVAISTHIADATSWILAIAAGVFIYIALVDLLPELIHSKERGWTRWGLFLMANIGFLISFVALLLLAVYEDQLNSIVSL